MILRLAVIGFGNVGQEFARMLLAKRDWLLKTKGLDVEVRVIATKTRGSISSKRPIDLEKALGLMKIEGTLKSYGPEASDLKPKDLLSKCDADMMVELSTLNVESGQPAIDHIRTAMENGMDVVTANKGPVAIAYNELRNLARSKGVHFRFEGTVMDGTPIFNLVERTLPACEVIGLTGILNSTSNFVLTQMSLGNSMDDAIREAQRRGFAESDPSLDIDGWDAAAKITALANVLMDAQSNPRMVQRTGIRDVTREYIREIASTGKKVKMVASARPTAEGVRLTVATEAVGPDHPFWSVDGTSSALTIKTDLMGDLTIIETNPSVTQTAYAVFSDMLLVVEAIRAGIV